MTLTLGGVLDEQLDSGNYALQVLFNSFPVSGEERGLREATSKQASKHGRMKMKEQRGSPLLLRSISPSVPLCPFPQIINKKGPLSDLPNVTFPIAAGPIQIVRTMTLPSIGKAAITVNASATDQNGQQLLCIGFVMNLNANPSEKGVLTPDQLWAAIQPEKKQQQIDAAASEEGEGEESLEDEEEAESSLFDTEEERLVVAVRPRPRARPSLKAALSDLLRFAAGEVSRFADALNDKESEAETAAEAVVNVPFTNCGSTASDLMSVQSVTSTVWPPVPGSTAVLTASVMANQQVNDGAYVALLSVDGLQLVNSTGSIKSFAPLPLMKGPLVLSKNVTLPASMPFSGTIGVQLSATNEMAQQLFCIAFSFAF